MTRKDSEKETDRPHYYSQFWLDVAAGRTVIGAAKVEDETDLVEDETEIPELEPEPTPLRRAGRNHAASVNDGYKSARTQTVVEPAFVPEEIEEPEDELFFEEDVEYEDEDEDEDGWSARGRKKPKPGRHVKTPKPTKKPKREPRRGF